VSFNALDGEKRDALFLEDAMAREIAAFPATVIETQSVVCMRASNGVVNDHDL
jgi:hypothetical protein